MLYNEAVSQINKKKIYRIITDINYLLHFLNQICMLHSFPDLNIRII